MALPRRTRGLARAAHLAVPDARAAEPTKGVPAPELDSLFVHSPPEDLLARVQTRARRRLAGRWKARPAAPSCAQTANTELRNPLRLCLKLLPHPLSPSSPPDAACLTCHLMSPSCSRVWLAVRSHDGHKVQVAEMSCMAFWLKPAGWCKCLPASEGCFASSQACHGEEFGPQVGLLAGPVRAALLVWAAGAGWGYGRSTHQGHPPCRTVRSNLLRGRAIPTQRREDACKQMMLIRVHSARYQLLFWMLY